MAVVVALATGLATLGGPSVAAPRPADHCSSGHVSLTFDDGPATPTLRLVRILRDVHVPATFFMVGQRVAAAPRVARRVERAGFLIANHSWAHVDMRTQTSAQVAATLRATDRVLRRAGTHPTDLVRPPYGALDDAARTGIRNAGLVPVLWTVDSRDWAGGSADEIATRILSALRRNQTNIVLQHDGVGHSPVSVDAVRAVVRGARSRGYCFTALDERGRPGFPTPQASVSVANVREGEHAVATVRLSAPAGRATSVRLRTRSRTARVGRDVERLVRRVEVPAGRLAARVRIRVPRDRTDEFAERFDVTIARPHGVGIDVGRAVSRIADIDPPPVVRGLDLEVTEPVLDPLDATVRLRLSRPSAKPIRLVVAARPGTADASDYHAQRLRTLLDPGTTMVPFELEVLPNPPEDAEAPPELDESFTVVVLRARRARIGRPATVTIHPPEPPETASHATPAPPVT